ncbi:Glutathione S-transferase zeta-1 [Coemansia sp. RSA 552]|nr:Glutathione S-transferase zeta-1 [Coemansia sp. RSA 552]
MDSKPALYSYYRSSSAARVRIALSYKGIGYETRPINLVKNEQQAQAYLDQNPGGLVPFIVIDGHAFGQSVAILEYLEETRPEKPLLPKDPVLRARVRSIVGAICSDIQPLQNLRVLKTLPEDQRAEHACRVITQGFAAIEKMLAQAPGRFCVGDEVTLADCCLIPQVINAQRFGVDLARFPRIQAVDQAANALDAFRAAHWSQQPDCPPELR